MLRFLTREEHRSPVSTIGDAGFYLPRIKAPILTRPNRSAILIDLLVFPLQPIKRLEIFYSK